MSLNPQTQRSLFESVGNIVNPKQQVVESNQEFDAEQIVLSFINEVFGNSLNESTDEEAESKITEAVYGLNALTVLVNEYFGLNEEN